MDLLESIDKPPISLYNDSCPLKTSHYILLNL